MRTFVPHLKTFSVLQVKFSTTIVFTLNYNNIVTKGTEGVICQLLDAIRKELVPMVTYCDLFTFVIMLCAVITLVIYAQRKK